MAERIDRDELLARVDLGAVLDALAGPRTSNGRWHCPDADHADEHPSVSVRTSDTGTQTWRCWSGGHRGTAIDAVMASRRIGVREAIEWLAENYGNLPIVDRPPTAPRRAVGDPDERVLDYINSAAKLLWTPAGKPHRDWLHARGLDEEVLRLNHVGADPGRRHLGRPRHGFPAGWPAVVYPALDPVGRPVFFQARYLDPPSHRGKYDSPSSTYAANPRLAWTTPVGKPIDGLLVVCEGVPDALIAAQAGLHTIGVLGTWAADRPTSEALATVTIESGCEIVICFDSDEAGRASADRLRRQLDECTAKSTTLSPPPGHDLTTWAATDEGWSARLLQTAVPQMTCVADWSSCQQPRVGAEVGLSMGLASARETWGVEAARV